MKRNPLLIIIMILAMLLAGGCGNKGTEIKVDTHTESNLMESKKGTLTVSPVPSRRQKS